MSLELTKLKYLGLYEEPAGDATFGVDNTASPASFIAMPYQEGSLKIDWDTELLDPMLGKDKIDGYDQQVLGRKTCSVAFDTVLHSHGLDLDGDVAPPTTSNWALMRLLKILFGGSLSTTNLSAQTTVQAGTTTTTVTVTTGHGARFSRGGVIACQTVSGSSRLELKEIASVSGDLVTVKEAFSATPVTGTPVRGGVTFYPTADPDTSAQFLYEGRELSHRFGFFGCQGTVALAVNIAKSLGKLSFNLPGVNWSRLSDGSGITVPSYTNVKPVRCIDAPLTVPSFGSTTRAPVHSSDFKLDVGLAYELEPSGAATNQQGARRWRRVPGRPLAKGVFTKRFEDQTDFATHEARTDKSIYQQLGVLAGEAMLVSVPLAQLGQPKEAGVGETSGLAVPFMGRPDTTGGTGDIDVAALRIHCV